MKLNVNLNNESEENIPHEYKFTPANWKYSFNFPFTARFFESHTINFAELFDLS